jgi:hypothetical protein
MKLVKPAQNMDGFHAASIFDPLGSIEWRFAALLAINDTFERKDQVGALEGQLSDESLNKILDDSIILSG